MKQAPNDQLTDELKDRISKAFQSVKAASPHFKSRKSQLILIRDVARTLAGFYGDRRILVAEAPTGTGKSLGYLISAIPVAQELEKRLIVSTGTVALQEQLVKRDIPALAKSSGLEFTAVLAKGRSRYVCNRNVNELANDDPNQLSIDVGEQVSAAWHFRPTQEQVGLVIDMWRQLEDRVWDGDLDDWKGNPVDDQVRTAVVVGQGACIGRNCPYLTKCGFFSARANMDKADVIVANHDLVMSDIMLGGGVVLPAQEDSIYIFDEAHHLPAVALARGASESSIRKSISLVTKLPKVVSEVNALCKIKAYKSKAEVGGARDYTKHLNRALMDAEEFLINNFPRTSVSAFFNKDDGETWRFEHGQIPAGLAELGEAVIEPAKSLQQILRTLADRIKTEVKAKRVSAATTTKATKNLGFQRENLDALVTTWQMILDENPPKGSPDARWVYRPAEKGRRAPDLSLNASPTSAARLLRSTLWLKAFGAVMVSATVTADKHFGRFMEQAGLRDNDGTQYLRLDSPFDYQNNSSLVIPMMRNEPSNPVAHTAEVAEQLNRIIDPAQGTLVLFTSRKQLKDICGMMRPDLKKLILAQGDIPKGEILVLHKKAIEAKKGSVIFGLSSFAEGVDLPGALCEHVIITKLPFSVPTSPIEAAYAEWLESVNRNPFMEIAVPDACTKLVQACGRLIRTETDTGVITLLDRRVVTKRYGKIVLNSLPPFKIEVEEVRERA